MHPAGSIIVFTTLSGLGFGLMVWLGTDSASHQGWTLLALAALSVVLVSIGLTASMLHLGQPRRFLLAFSQWRSSWLSREGVLSLSTLACFALYTALDRFAGVHLDWLGALSALLALATVLATAMIYAQLKAVPRWHSPLTPLVFLMAALAGGALLGAEFSGAVAALVCLGLIQLADWITGDRRFAAAGSTLATATGLGDLGRLRLLEPPHTGQNYLLREMVYVIGRAHARKLRIIGLTLAVVLPLGIVLLLPGRPIPSLLAALVHLSGIIILRWLFFAQAEHVVGLYYGRR